MDLCLCDFNVYCDTDKSPLASSCTVYSQIIYLYDSNVCYDNSKVPSASSYLVKYMFQYYTACTREIHIASDLYMDKIDNYESVFMLKLDHLVCQSNGIK